MSTIRSPDLSSNIAVRDTGKQLAVSQEPVVVVGGKLPPAPGSHTSHDSISADTTLVRSWTGTTKTAGSPSAVNAVALPTADTGFTSADEILSLARTIPGDALVVVPTSLEEYRALEDLRDQQDEKLRFLYRAEYALLIVTVPTAMHEQLHIGLDRRVLYQVISMGLDEDWASSGATTFRSTLGSGSAGEGDSGGRPASTRPGHRQWPTLVIEAGWTQTLASLRCRKDFWFKDSQHHVKIVLLAKGYSANDEHGGAERRILLEHWQERASLQRPGATETRLHAASHRDSICLQTINIVWAGAAPYHVANDAMRRDPNNFNVTRGPLRLDFARVFLRQPAGGHEHDIVVDDSALQRYAVGVWFE